MGLLLSVLVVCVGVLEVIACVRHFQDGYLPLWTPHCAVTSGYAKTHDRWRNKPSDSHDFRSGNDVSGALNHAQDQSSETFLQPSSSVENGYTVKHDFENTSNQATPSKQVHCFSDDTSPIFNDENRIQDLQGTDISPSLENEECDLNLISNYEKELNYSTENNDERKEISTSYDNQNLISGVVDNLSETTDSQKYLLLNTTWSNNETVLESDKVTSNIIGEKQSSIGSDGYAIHQVCDKEIIPITPLKSETSENLQYLSESVAESIKDSSDERLSKNVSVLQEEIISQLPSIERASQDAFIHDIEESLRETKTSVDEDRVSYKNPELQTDLTSEQFESLIENDSVKESEDEKPCVPVSDAQIKSEQNIISPAENLEENDLSNIITNVPKNHNETLETEIERHKVHEQIKLNLAYDNEQSVSAVDFQDIEHNGESTPQLNQEYVPLTSIEVKYEVPSDDTKEETNVESRLPDNTSQEIEDIVTKNNSADTSIFEHENRPRQEVEEISKRDELYIDEINNIHTDREITPQSVAGKDIEKTKDIGTTLSLHEDKSGNQPDISKPSSEFEPVLLVTEGEESAITNRIEDIAESRLDYQTTSTELIPKNEEIGQDFSLTIDTSEDLPPLTRHSAHQPSMSPPQLPSTPTKKSKADISLANVFPWSPCNKRPSVSFATPEAVFTNEDQELLRQYAEEAVDITPCIKKSEEIRNNHWKHPREVILSRKMFSQLHSKKDLLPNIVAGNDFSRKELQLQRKKSFKQKRYSSATELATRDEEAEDRSFSENKPNIVRASSLKESRR
ncbi:hypothetical protein L9F63_028022, partial [Diploptera punctata]